MAQSDKLAQALKEINATIDIIDRDKKLNILSSLDAEYGIIRIFSANADAIQKAISALKEVSELSYSTAEHHPFWAVLYHCTEISKLILENWDSNLDANSLNELNWRCDEIKGTLERISDFTQ
jgi:hypothetical protein